MRKGSRKLEETEYRGRFPCKHLWVEYVSPFCGRMKEGCPKCGAWKLVKKREEKVA